MTNRATTNQEKLNPPVFADAHDDNHDFNVTFDATEWFAQATVAELEGLIECGFGGDLAADSVACYFDGVHDGVTELFRYKRNCGFECYVNAQQASTWLSIHHPEIKQL